MSVRLPTQGIASFTDVTVGSASVAGGIPHPFLVPQDTDNIVIKFTASTIGGSASALLQTSDDGGTTFYDVARTSIVSNGVPQWLSATTISNGVNTQAITTGGSILTGAIGTAAASTLGQNQVSGLPILGTANRVFIIHSGAATVASIVTTVRVNQQSATTS